MTRKYTYIVVGGIILGIIISLGIWSLFIKGKQGTVEDISVARGLGGSIPSFEGSLGSINANARAALDLLGSAVGNTSNNSATTTFTPPVLWQISATETIGLSNAPQSSTLLYFVEKVSGNIFSKDTKTGLTQRLTNTLFPYVNEVVWVNASTSIMRSLTERGTATAFLSTITQATSTSSLVGDYFETDIRGISPSPDGTSFFYIRPQSGRYVGVVHTLEDGNERRVWSSLIGGWTTTWLTPDTIVFKQNTAQGVTGSIYLLSLSSGTFSPILTNIAGLSAAVSPNGSDVVYSESYVNKLATFIKTKEGIRTLPFKTLGEKCVWTPDQNFVYCAVPEFIPSNLPYPDSWYRGEFHTSDSWWRINTQTGNVEPYLSPDSEFSQKTDVQDPKISPDGSYIMYTNNMTGRSWVMQTSR